MESFNSGSGSGSGSTASALPANVALAIRDEEGAFKCKWCRSTFETARARGGHLKAHSQLPEYQENKKVNKVLHPTVPSSYATALRSACLRAQPFAEWGSHYDPSAYPAVPPSFPWETGTTTGSPVVALAAGGTEDGGRLGRIQDVRELSQEEHADGIDLTLKL